MTGTASLRDRIRGVLPESAARVYGSAQRGLRRAVYRVQPYSTLPPVEKYRRDGWNTLLTEGLPLTKDSVLLDFGGYLGDYAAAMTERYACRVHVFEPIPEFAEACRRRFAAQPSVTVHEYGIGRSEEKRSFGLTEDATGAFAVGEQTTVEFRAASSLANELRGPISVIAMNIEGGEYELIPALAETGLLQRAERIFVQFHRVGPDPTGERQRCRSILAETHECLWDYDFVWEAWALRAR
jgi:FkbM family methyltransferase